MPHGSLWWRLVWQGSCFEFATLLSRPPRARALTQALSCPPQPLLSCALPMLSGRFSNADSARLKAPLSIHLGIKTKSELIESPQRYPTDGTAPKHCNPHPATRRRRVPRSTCCPTPTSPLILLIHRGVL